MDHTDDEIEQVAYEVQEAYNASRTLTEATAKVRAKYPDFDRQTVFAMCRAIDAYVDINF